MIHIGYTHFSPLCIFSFLFCIFEHLFVYNLYIKDVFLFVYYEVKIISVLLAVCGVFLGFY